MRSFLSRFGVTTLLLFSATSAPAQTTNTAPGVATTPSTSIAPGPILSVALPPNVRLRLDVDARDEDLLGVVKSFLRGFNGRHLQALLGSTAPASGPATPGGAPPQPAPEVTALQALSDTDLETMLQDVTHLRMVMFEIPRNPRSNASGTGAQSPISFYEQAYLGREGGRRLIRADFDEMQLLTVGFPNGGFAAVMQGPGIGMVLRANGYPNFEAIGPLVMAFSLRMFPASQR